MPIKKSKAEREKELYKLYLTQEGRAKLTKLLQGYQDNDDGIPIADGTPLIESILFYEYPPARNE